MPPAPPPPSPLQPQAQAQPFRALAQLLADGGADGGTDERDAARPLLAMLIGVTGLECAYVSRVDERQDHFRVLVSQATDPAGVDVPEGLETTWTDALCRRVFAAGLTHTDQAALLWPDNQGVRELKIRTYVGQPIRDRHGATIGTLCAASQQPVPVPAAAVLAVALFTRLLAAQLEHDRVVRAAGEAFVADSTAAIAGAMALSEDPAALEGQLRQAFGMDPWMLGC